MSFLITLDNNLFVGNFEYRPIGYGAQIKFTHGPLRDATNFSKEVAESWIPDIKTKWPNAKIIPRKKALQNYESEQSKAAHQKNH